ncbi:spore cortex biosynthesis protein YabQ [Marinicrinis sediminis]|uniref:Spore cortex biosynthesis protein YabQ n=1 Tax=Marinicrinis sediminis TaxID=1652465 RepID=A0ABW5R9U4_9BACL
MSLHTQLMTLLMMFMSGVIMGMVFDMYRVTSSQLRFKRWLIPVLDLCYWVLSGLFVFQMLAITNHGQVRVYIFLALAAGTVAYHYGCSQLVQRMTLLLIHLVRRTIQILVMLFRQIVIKPLIGCYRLLKFIIGIVIGITMYIVKIMLQLGYPLWRLVRWLCAPILRWRLVQFSIHAVTKITVALRNWMKSKE